jgi:hypothetical protein
MSAVARLGLYLDNLPIVVLLFLSTVRRWIYWHPKGFRRGAEMAVYILHLLVIDNQKGPHGV